MAKALKTGEGVVLDVAMGTDHLLDVNWTSKKESSGSANVRSGREVCIELWWGRARGHETLWRKLLGVQKFTVNYLTQVGQTCFWRSKYTHMYTYNFVCFDQVSQILLSVKVFLYMSESQAQISQGSSLA